jgi:2-oxoglutarate ferredoxin oxidoreductase subunit delta
LLSPVKYFGDSTLHCKENDMPKIEIDELRCKGCGLCPTVCPKKCVVLSEQINNHGYTTAILDETNNKCIGCALCAEMCPDVAILVFK